MVLRPRVVTLSLFLSLSLGCGDSDDGSSPDANASDSNAADAAADGAVADAAPPDATSAVFAGMTATQTSVWQFQAMLGVAAGDAMCADMAAGSAACTYQEVLIADAAGEFAAVPNGTEAWLHRVFEVVDVNGSASSPGAGGRCNDWTYPGGDLSDGESVTFGAGGLTYSFDPDTTYDGTNANFDGLQCGNESRVILCCYPPAPPF